MKTLVDIDEELLDKAMKLTNTKTKKATIHTALQELVRSRRRQELISQMGSGMLDLSLEELEELRHSRPKKHNSGSKL